MNITIMLIMFLFAMLAIIISLLVSLRIDDVVCFRIDVWNMAHKDIGYTAEEDVKWHRADDICNKTSFERMVYSLKPLKMKYWYTDEEIDFINNHAKIN